MATTEYYAEMGAIVYKASGGMWGVDYGDLVDDLADYFIKVDPDFDRTQFFEACQHDCGGEYEVTEGGGIVDSVVSGGLGELEGGDEMCTALDRHPGKRCVLRGESCITRAAYAWMVNGAADEQGSTEEGTPDVFNGPFTVMDTVDTEGNEMCDECIATLLGATTVRLWESDQGFVHVNLQ